MQCALPAGDIAEVLGSVQRSFQHHTQQESTFGMAAHLIIPSPVTLLR